MEKNASAYASSRDAPRLRLLRASLARSECCTRLKFPMSSTGRYVPLRIASR
jgi:hypothetical protein